MSAQPEMWRVSTIEGVFETDLETLKQWIVEGCVLPTDKVSKGNSVGLMRARPKLKGAFEGVIDIPPASSPQPDTETIKWLQVPPNETQAPFEPPTKRLIQPSAPRLMSKPSRVEPACLSRLRNDAGQSVHDLLVLARLLYVHSVVRAIRTRRSKPKQRERNFRVQDLIGDFLTAAVSMETQDSFDWWGFPLRLVVDWFRGSLFA
jgi:hypothetical protein